MERFERFHRMDAMLQNGKVVPAKVFLEKFEISIATFKRDLDYMRDRLQWPIVWDGEQGGYRLDMQAGQPVKTLPGLWFNSDEAFALLTMKGLLSDLEPGLLGPQVQVLLDRIGGLFADQTGTAAQIDKRLLVRKTFARSQQHAHFPVIANALLKRERLNLVHLNRATGARTGREVSPQRLVHHRDNWYLDAWCHLREDVRSFGLDAIESAGLAGRKAKEVSLKEVARLLDNTYGIFSGEKEQWAELSFSPKKAQWVGREMWHPRQTVWTGNDGRHYMRLPFSNSTELLMDILRHLPDVRVEKPAALRKELKQMVVQWLAAESG